MKWLCVIQRTYMKGRKPCNIFYILYISNNEYMNNTAKAKQPFYIQFSTLMTISLFLVFSIARVHFTRHCSYTSHRKHNWSVFNSVRRSNIIRQLNNYHFKHIWSASNSSRYSNTSCTLFQVQRTGVSELVILTSCQLHRITSGQSNSVMSKFTFQNSSHT